MKPILKYNPDDKFLLTDVTAQPLRGRADVRELENACAYYDAVAVAANQLGLAEPWIYMTAATQLSNNKATGIVAYKPSYQAIDEVRETGREGCISLPGRVFVVERWRRVRAQWFTFNGTRVEKILRGYVARIFQHECDHLRGLTLVTTAKWEIK